MPFLGDLRFDTSSDDGDEDLSFEKPRGRGKGEQWTVLHSYGTVEEFNDNYQIVLTTNRLIHYVPEDARTWHSDATCKVT